MVDLGNFFPPQMSHHFSVVDNCTRALELNPRYVKALTRRLKAYENVGKKKDALMGENIHQSSPSFLFLLSSPFHILSFYPSLHLSSHPSLSHPTFLCSNILV